MIYTDLIIIVIIMAFTCPMIFSQSLLNINHLVRIKDIYYNKSKNTPFTGSVFKLSSNTWSKIMETELVDGVIHGSYYEWYDFNKRKKKDAIRRKDDESEKAVDSSRDSDKSDKK